MPTNSRAITPSRWLSVRLREHDRGPDELPHGFYSSHCDIDSDFAVVGQLVDPLSFGFDAYGLHVLPVHEAVGRARVDQEQPFPHPVRLGRVPYATVTCIAPIPYPPYVSAASISSAGDMV